MTQPVGILDYITNKFIEAESKDEKQELVTLFWIAVEGILESIGDGNDKNDNGLLEPSLN